MTDFATISAALSSLKEAYGLAKMIKESSGELDKAETKYQLAELVSALADTKIELSDIRNLVNEKNDRIKELETLLTIRAELKYEPPYYWRVNDVDDKDGPFCQKCWDVDSLLVRLQLTKSGGLWECKNCRKSYTDSNYTEPSLVKF